MSGESRPVWIAPRKTTFFKRDSLHEMIYGIILESARDGVLVFYGEHVWKRIVHELKLPTETFALFSRYDHQLMFRICECMAQVLEDGTPESYLEFFGQDFVRYFVNFGFDKILRVAGRTIRDFLFAIDQLHDSNRFSFPQMHQPLFHVTEENESGAMLVYKSVRHGFARYAIGGLVSAAKTLFQEDIKMTIKYDSSTKEYAHVSFWVQFKNDAVKHKRMFDYPLLPDVDGTTFFRVFPFSILMDANLNIRRMGKHIINVFPDDVQLIDRPLDEVFRLIRPDIHVEWDKILSYGRHIVFLMENRLPLRVSPSGRIRLKGQMKYLSNKNMLWFLCHPVLGSTDDVISAGLYLTDLNLFDSTSDLLITAMQQERAIEKAIAKQQVWLTKLTESKKDLVQWRQKSQRLLYSVLPKHIAVMLQSGIQPNFICESHPLVTVLFAYMMDFKSLCLELDPVRLIECLNEIISTFDQIVDKYDVFKLETKADASYMVVAGLSDRSHINSIKSEPPTSPTMHDYNDEDDEMDEKVNKNPLGLNQAEIIASLALALQTASLQIINPATNEPFKTKLGFHSGPVVGGIVGQKNIQYCLFGDTINMASRITTTGEIGQVHISHSAYAHLVCDNRFIIESRGEIEMKGKGIHSTYWLLGETKKVSSNGINKTSSGIRCPFTGKFYDQRQSFGDLSLS